MCGPAVAWDWFVLDFAYILIVVAAGAIFRARSSSLFTWVLFGVLAVAVGSFLFSGTYVFQIATAQSGAPTGATIAAATAC